MGFRAGFRGGCRGGMNGVKNIQVEEKKEAEKEMAVVVEKKRNVKERLGNKDSYSPMKIIDEPKRTMSAKHLRLNQESRQSTRNEEDDDEGRHE